MHSIFGPFLDKDADLTNMKVYNSFIKLTEEDKRFYKQMIGKKHGNSKLTLTTFELLKKASVSRCSVKETTAYIGIGRTIYYKRIKQYKGLSERIEQRKTLNIILHKMQILRIAREKGDARLSLAYLKIYDKNDQARRERENKKEESRKYAENFFNNMPIRNQIIIHEKTIESSKEAIKRLKQEQEELRNSEQKSELSRSERIKTRRG